MSGLFLDHARALTLVVAVRLPAVTKEPDAALTREATSPSACCSIGEANGLNVEVHGGGVGNLHVLGSMVSPGLHYGRGLLHPFIDHDEMPAWLNKPMDNEGFVHISQDPSLGYDSN